MTAAHHATRPPRPQLDGPRSASSLRAASPIRATSAAAPLAPAQPAGPRSQARCGGSPIRGAHALLRLRSARLDLGLASAELAQPEHQLRRLAPGVAEPQRRQRRRRRAGWAKPPAGSLRPEGLVQRRPYGSSLGRPRADASRVHFERLVIEAGDDTFSLDLHHRMTVIAGVGRLEREGLITELLGALGPGPLGRPPRDRLRRRRPLRHLPPGRRPATAWSTSRPAADVTDAVHHRRPPRRARAGRPATAAAPGASSACSPTTSSPARGVEEYVLTPGPDRPGPAVGRGREGQGARAPPGRDRPGRRLRRRGRGRCSRRSSAATGPSSWPRRPTSGSATCRSSSAPAPRWSACAPPCSTASGLAVPFLLLAIAATTASIVSGSASSGPARTRRRRCARPAAARTSRSRSTGSTGCSPTTTPAAR